MVEKFYQFFKEMESGGIAAFAPEHMIKVIDVSEDDRDDKDFDVFADSK